MQRGMTPAGLSYVLSIAIGIGAAVPECGVAEQPTAGREGASASSSDSEKEAGKDGDSKQADRKLPPGLKIYMGRRIAPTMSYLGAPWLIRESRAREENPEKLLAALKIKPGQTVCDIGCGNGFHSLKMAKLVGTKGKVLGVDIQPEMLELLVKRARKSRVNNVKPILGTVADPKLPAGEVDLVLMVDVYHEFSHPEQMLKKIRAALAPQGRVALVEFRAEDPDVPIKPLHKMTKKQILKEFPANGFRLVEQYDKLPWQHVMLFQATEQKPDEAGP